MRCASRRWHTSGAALFTLAVAACGSGTEHSDTTGGAAGSVATSGGAAQTNKAGQSSGGSSQNAGGAPNSTGGVDPSVGAAGGDTAVPGPSADCTFEIATTGAVAATYAPDLMSCTTVGAQLYAIFVREDRLQAGILAPGFKESDTGVTLPASFEIGKLDFGGWRTSETGCTVEVTEQVLLGPAPYADRAGPGRQYRITGHGNCSEPATDPTGAAADITVGSFSFRARKSFYAREQ